MTKQQRKILLICFGIVVASYIARFVVTSAMQMAYHPQQAIRRAQKAKPKPSPSATASSNPAAPLV